MIARQTFIISGATSLAAAPAAALPYRPAQAASFEVSYSDDEWRKRLTAEQFAVLRQAGTERPLTSPLNKEKRRGTFACAGCDFDLFSSTTKFESGRPRWKKRSAARRTSRYGMVRTAVHCSRCGGHLGHVFDHGPKPTGLRYCMNGLAMTFKPLAS